MSKKSENSDEIWDLKYSISNFIVPRLHEYKEKCKRGENISVPTWINDSKESPVVDEDKLNSQWVDILEKMTIPFEYHTNPEKYNQFSSEEIDSMVAEGLILFAKYFIHLWD